MPSAFDQLIKLIDFKESNSWVWWQGENLEFSDSFSKKKRPWFCYDTESIADMTNAIAMPKTTQKHNGFYQYPKNQDFDRDGWVPPLRKSIDMSRAEFHCIEQDNALKDKIFNFYNSKSWKIKEA
tara:strand:- start:792 stop:1166 length:375 start_codon:yes stop_codon:yes gene_type:complete